MRNARDDEFADIVKLGGRGPCHDPRLRVNFQSIQSEVRFRLHIDEFARLMALETG